LGRLLFEVHPHVCSALLAGVKKGKEVKETPHVLLGFGGGLFWVIGGHCVKE
jgi:hypothetical protein